MKIKKQLLKYYFPLLFKTGISFAARLMAMDNFGASDIDYI